VPERVPLELPRFDGTGWPEAAGRPSFEASTYREMGSRRAYEPAAHHLAGQLVADVLPRLSTGASAEDEPYLRKVFLTAARLGVGLGLVERDGTASGPDAIDADVVGALAQARRGLPAMQPDWERTAAWFLLAGHYLARQEPRRYDDALWALVEAAAVDGGERG